MFRNINNTGSLNVRYPLIKFRHRILALKNPYNSIQLKAIQPLLLLSLAFEILFYLILGNNSIGSIELDRIKITFCFTLVIYISAINIILIISLNKRGKYTCPITKGINIKELWSYSFRHYELNSLPKFFIVVLTPYCLTSSANLVRIYQQHATNWYDTDLYNLEHSWIDFILKIYHYISPVFFDSLYVSIWPIILFLTFILIFTLKTSEHLLHLSITVIISYMMTRTIGLLFSTAGPVYLKPEIFPVAGTTSELLQLQLKLFMEGKIQQNILFPGTMAMPSLHVGLIYLVAATLFRINKYTLALTLPLFILTWLATVVLGWHYILDGIGGIFVMYLSSAISLYYIGLFGLKYS
jgi:membrane-associated phospholipid phosphatase